MKSISLVKFFTVVSFLVVGIQVQLHAKSSMTQEACKLTCAKRAKSACVNESGDNYSGCVSKQQDTCESAESCDNLESKEDSKDKKNSCKQLQKEYDEAMKKTNEECGYMDVSNSEECREKADNCKRSLDSFGSSEFDSDAAAGAMGNILGILGAFTGGRGGEGSECLIENDEKAADKEENTDEKITRLREEIADLKEKAGEADKDYADKKQDVEEQILEIEVEANKAKFEKQTENQKAAGERQKDIMASEKKRKDNIIRMANLQVEIANLVFAQQKLALELSSDIVVDACAEKKAAVIALKYKGIPDSNGRIAKPNFSLKESKKIIERAKNAEIQCLKEAALKRQAGAKGIIDNKRKLQVEIDSLAAANADEAKAIENQLKQMEALKAISEKEEAEAIEAKHKKLNSLNNSITDMEKYVADKKKSYAEKEKAKNDQISKLMLDRQKVKPRFARVSAIAQTSGLAAASYMEECCTEKPYTSTCMRIMKSDPDMKPRKLRSAGSKK